MLTAPAGLMIYIATRPVDFRKGADGLALLAKETLGHDPMKGVAVVFRAKRADRVKIVVWDGSGLVLYWKRLDGSGFKWPPIVASVMRMNAAQLSALLLLAWIGRACTHLEFRSRKRLRRTQNLRCIGARSMADSGQ